MFDQQNIELLRREAKRELRKRLRNTRLALMPSVVRQRSEKIVEQILSLEFWQKSSSVALFWPLLDRHEIDLRPLLDAANKTGKKAYFPWTDTLCNPRELRLRQVKDASEFKERGLGYEEPQDDAPEAEPGEIGLVIVPALAVDKQGNRLGYGAGFYDRLLPKISPPAQTVAAVFSFQILAEVPVADWDVRVGHVLTEEGFWRAEPQQRYEPVDAAKPLEITRPGEETGVRVVLRPGANR